MSRILLAVAFVATAFLFNGGVATASPYADQCPPIDGYVVIGVDINPDGTITCRYKKVPEAPSGY